MSCDVMSGHGYFCCVSFSVPYLSFLSYLFSSSLILSAALCVLVFFRPLASSLYLIYRVYDIILECPALSSLVSIPQWFVSSLPCMHLTAFSPPLSSLVLDVLDVYVLDVDGI